MNAPKNKKYSKKTISIDPTILAQRLGKVEKRLGEVEKMVDKHEKHLTKMEQHQLKTHDAVIESKESIEELGANFEKFLDAESTKEEARTKELIELTVKANKYPKLVYMVFGGVIGLFASTLLFMLLILLASFLPYNPI